MFIFKKKILYDDNLYNDMFRFHLMLIKIRKNRSEFDVNRVMMLVYPLSFNSEYLIFLKIT
jgi:hypothetical protein